MSTFETVESAKVIKEFSKLNNGEILQQDSILGSLYTHIPNPGETVILKDKKGFAAFHFDHDDILNELQIDKYGWQIHFDEERISMTLIIPHLEGPYIIAIPMDYSGDSKNLIDFIKSKKKLDIHFAGILFGELVKSSSHTFKLPKEIIKQLK